MILYRDASADDLEGAARITLNVWAFNERAVELYRELGYEIRSHAMGKRLLAQS